MDHRSQADARLILSLSARPKDNKPPPIYEFLILITGSISWFTHRNGIYLPPS